MAGLADSYSHFSKTVNILQKINMLPHVKFDAFEDCRHEFEEMSVSVELNNCKACASLPTAGTASEVLEDGKNSSGESDIEELDENSNQEVDGEGSQDGREQLVVVGQDGDQKTQDQAKPDPPKCKWPLLHKHMLEYNTEGTFRKVQMGSLAADPLRPGNRSAIQEERQIKLLGVEGIIKKVLKRCKSVSDYLHRGMYKVYNDEDRKVVKAIRVVLDLEKRIQELKNDHFAYLSSKNTAMFLEAARKIDPDLDSKYEADELRLQYRQHLKCLATVANTTGSEKLSSMEVFGMLLNTEKRLYEGCEAVMDVMTQAAVLITSEGIVEGWISTHEQHNPKSRPLSFFG